MNSRKDYFKDILMVIVISNVTKIIIKLDAVAEVSN
jgi:hypothetical protein